MRDGESKFSKIIYKLIDSLFQNTFAKEKDFAIYGKSGSDVLFTENGLQLRGGKLLSKEAASTVNRQTMIDYPIMAKKSSRIYLKKFPKKMKLEEVLSTENVTENKDLSFIIEYDVDKLKDVNDENQATISIYLYKVIGNYGNVFKSNYFTENSVVTDSLVKLVNTDNTSTTPTYTAKVSSISEAYKEIRD